MNINDVLLYLSLKYNGEWLTVYDSLRNRERVNESDLHSVWNNIDCKYVSMLDDNYPEGLKSIYKPPISLNLLLCRFINKSKTTITQLKGG